MNKKHTNINARLAITENERLTKHFYNDVKKYATKNGKTLLESLHVLCILRMKWCTNDNEKASLSLRAKNVEKMIKDDWEESL